MLMNKKRKRFWRIMVISVIIILSTPVLIFSWGMYKTFIMRGIEVNCIEVYISGEFLNLPGGDMLDGAIPTYEELGDYVAIAFYYVDLRRKSGFFREFYIGFGLDVRYCDEVFPEIMEELGITDEFEFVGRRDGFTGIKRGERENVAFWVGYRGGINVIRYVAVVGEDIDLGWIIFNNPAPPFDRLPPHLWKDDE